MELSGYLAEKGGRGGKMAHFYVYTMKPSIVGFLNIMGTTQSSYHCLLWDRLLPLGAFPIVVNAILHSVATVGS